MLDVCHRRKAKANAHPEPTGKGAAEEDVIGALERSATDGAPRFVGPKNVFLQQSMPGQDALLDEQPSEEPDLRRGMIVPDKGGGGIVNPSHGHELVQGSGIQSARGFAAAHQQAFVPMCELTYKCVGIIVLIQAY